jgi:hypothetical protein
MIHNEPEYLQSKRALNRLETALAALRRRVEPVNEELFRSMAQSYLISIEQIRTEIDEYIGLTSAELARAPLWMTLEGERLAAKEISSRLLTDWLGKLRRALQNVGEYVSSSRLLFGRPSSELLELTDPRIVALRPGSIRIGIRLPVPESQIELFPTDAHLHAPIAYRALARILDMVSWAQSTEVALSKEKFPDSTEAIILINQVSALVPARNGAIRAVRFTGALVPDPTGLRISSDARARLRRLAASLTETHIDSVEGVVREIDLDAQRIILRERGPERPDIKCYLPDDLVERAESLLDRHVRVSGRFSSVAPDTVDVISMEEIPES